MSRVEQEIKDGQILPDQVETAQDLLALVKKAVTAPAGVVEKGRQKLLAAAAEKKEKLTQRSPKE